MITSRVVPARDHAITGVHRQHAAPGDIDSAL
jgi:hypothetical protein